jgi:hypothetical protein
MKVYLAKYTTGQRPHESEGYLGAFASHASATKYVEDVLEELNVDKRNRQIGIARTFYDTPWDRFATNKDVWQTLVLSKALHICVDDYEILESLNGFLWETSGE